MGLSRDLLSWSVLALLSLLLAACATMDSPGDGTLALSEAPPSGSIPQAYADWLYRWRTWRPLESQAEDAQQLAIEADIPIQEARAGLLGPTVDEAQRSLAMKLWLIENARQTIDVNYYIFKRDRIGMAFIGALCDAVKRGVDVRVTVDSIGSIGFGHPDLRALATCADEAGLVADARGRPTKNPARAQVVLFNALTRFNLNRRSHDKLLVVDGMDPERAVVVTGGRNVSFDYYGFNKDGTTDPTTFRDMEIVLRPARNQASESHHVGEVASVYYTVLFDYRGNRYLEPILGQVTDDEYSPAVSEPAEVYKARLRLARESLRDVLAFPGMQELMRDVPGWLDTGLRDSRVLLAHELDNLTNVNVVDEANTNKSRNPNSILNLLDEIAGRAQPGEVVTIVSPYLFLARLTDSDGRVVYDEVDNILQWLDEHGNSRLEIITNSVLTSDNFFAQSVIDMDTAPRLLLTPELQQVWLSGWKSGDLNLELVDSAEWGQLTANPQIRIYETGGSDSVTLGGPVHYGKMHAKFLAGKNFGWVGTSNFDYRSRLLNNEMGFFFDDERLCRDLLEDAEVLKRQALRWGSPEWLALRRDVSDAGGIKGFTTRTQRLIYKTLIGLGLVWQF